MGKQTPRLVAGMLSLFLSGTGIAQDYQWTEIVIPGTTVAQAWQINDKGQVAIGVTTDERSGIYQDGTFTPLPPPPEGFQFVGALGINNDGVIAGTATDIGGHRQGFILRGSTYTFFSRPGADNTYGRAIADSGLVTGYSDNTDGSTAGFVYDPVAESFTDATPPGSTNTITQGMNNLGRISGHGTQPGIGRYGFVWQQEAIFNGTSELMPFLDRTRIDVGTSARGINDSGVIVGFLSTPTGTNDGFVGSAALGYLRLVAPGGEIAGNSTICSGINNFAQVVCYVWDSTSTPLSAFIGSPAAGMTAPTRQIAGSPSTVRTNSKRSEQLPSPAPHWQAP